MIGIVDYAKQKDTRYSHDSGNAFCYYGYNSEKCPGNTFEGSGFKKGDIVEVDVDRENKSVKYLINGIVQARQQS